MFRSLARLKSFIVPYQRRLGLGIGAFGVARLFEGFVPMFVALAIDRMSSGNPDMTLPVAGILRIIRAFSSTCFSIIGLKVSALTFGT